jgi:hypothetical protein
MVCGVWDIGTALFTNEHLCKKERDQGRMEYYLKTACMYKQGQEVSTAVCGLGKGVCVRAM